MGHPNEELFFDEHVCPKENNGYGHQAYNVVEIGSRQIDKSSINWRKKFNNPRGYVGVDIKAGLGVDIVLDIVKDDLPQQYLADILICNSVLEHVPEPFDVAEEMCKLLAKGGVLFITVPFAWKYSKHPNDYWRFTHEGMEELFPNIEWKVIKYSTSKTGDFYDKPLKKLIKMIDGVRMMPMMKMHCYGVKK